MNNKQMNYIIDGKSYMFKYVCYDNKRLYGYCEALQKWAWLYPMFVKFKGGNIKIAERV